MGGQPIDAVIGVRRSGPMTWYVRRSLDMSNYKGVWSLPSIKFDPKVITDMQDVDTIQTLFDRLSAERLGSVPMRVMSHLTSGSSDQNPMDVDVTLHLYEVEMEIEAVLEPRYYTDAAWMDAAEYEDRSRGQPCGLCTRLWGDFAWLSGHADRPFIAHAASVDTEQETTK